MSEELKEKILKIFDGKKLACLATIRKGKPWVRYVMVSGKELDLYFTSGISARKIDDIKNNNNVHLTFGFDQSNYTSPYVQVAGKAEIITDNNLKKEFWNDMLKTYFKGPDDPNYCVVKVKPELIELVEGHGADDIKVYKP
jgi:general stress protein 26